MSGFCTCPEGYGGQQCQTRKSYFSGDVHLLGYVSLVHYIIVDFLHDCHMMNHMIQHVSVVCTVYINVSACKPTVPVIF